MQEEKPLHALHQLPIFLALKLNSVPFNQPLHDSKCIAPGSNT